MSVSNQTNKVYGSGNGVTTTFSYAFKIFDVSELYAYTIVTATGVVTGPLTYNVDFTATISAVTEGGTITFTVAPPTGTTWFLKRIVPQTQTAVIPSEGVFPGKQFENQLDLLTMMAIQTNEAVSRCLQLPSTYLGSLPVSLPSGLANAAIGWDPTGTFLTNVLVTAVGTVPIPITDNYLNQIVTTGKVSGTALVSLASTPANAGIFPVANLASGTPTGTKFIRDDGTLQVIPSPTTSSVPYVKVSETQTSGTNGGGATSGSWITRVLNTKDSDTGAIASIGSNLITLPAGTYRVRASVPFVVAGSAQLRLYNITDSAVLLTGQSTYIATNSGPAASGGLALLSGLFTLAGSKAIALQYQVQTSAATDGLGAACSFGTEVYSIIELEKIA